MAGEEEVFLIDSDDEPRAAGAHKAGELVRNDDSSRPCRPLLRLRRPFEARCLFG